MGEGVADMSACTCSSAPAVSDVSWVRYTPQTHPLLPHCDPRLHYRSRLQRPPGPVTRELSYGDLSEVVVFSLDLVAMTYTSTCKSV